jgi:hypothetical protein
MPAASYETAGGRKSEAERADFLRCRQLRTKQPEEGSLRQRRVSEMAASYERMFGESRGGDDVWRGCVI